MRKSQRLRRAARRNPKLAAAYRWLKTRGHEIRLKSLVSRAGDAEEHSRVDPAKVVWIFGSGRSGSTWLRSMMAELPNHEVWEEPLVGKLFGNFHENAPKSNLERPEFILGDSTRAGWTRSVRNFILDGAVYARPRLGPGDYLVVKEPNGSVGAPLVVEALPESRMVCLIRDPRDVVASVLDGARTGNWLREHMTRGGSTREPLADEKPDVFVRKRARIYLRDAGGARRAHELHTGPKTLIRYEDLLADTPATMRRVYSELGIPVDAEELERIVEKHSWENIPEKERGEGKFYRKGVAGGWREDLTPAQVRIVEETTAPILEEFYPDG